MAFDSSPVLSADNRQRTFGRREKRSFCSSSVFCGSSVRESKSEV